MKLQCLLFVRLVLTCCFVFTVRSRSLAKVYGFSIYRIENWVLSATGLVSTCLLIMLGLIDLDQTNLDGY